MSESEEPSRLSVNSDSDDSYSIISVDSDDGSSVHANDSDISRYTVRTSSDDTNASRISISSSSLLDWMSDVSSEEDLFREARYTNPDYEGSIDEEPDPPCHSIGYHCTICLEPINNDLIQTPCAHHFHKTCLVPACEVQEKCPNCRFDFSERWLHANQIVITMTALEFWAQFDESFGDVPMIGPLIPTHQAQRDIHYSLIPRMPNWWGSSWIGMKLVEIKIRYNIHPDYETTVADLRHCEFMGIRSRSPHF